MRAITLCLYAVMAIVILGLAGFASSNDESIIVLESGDLLTEFDVGAFGGVRSISDRQTGVEFRSDESVPASLLQFTCVLPSGRAASYSNRDARAFDYQLDEDGSQQTLHLRFYDVGIDGLDVVCSIVASADHEMQWRIEISAAQEFRLRDVIYPCFSGMSGIGGDSKDDWLVYPLWEGFLIPDYQSAIRRLGSWSWTSEHVYPGDLSMQFMAQYDDTVGLYLAALDSSGAAKRFEFLSQSEASRWQIVTQTSEEPRVTYQQSYPTVLKLFHGDWYDAAAIYRAWASDQQWCSSTVLENTSLPDWFLAGEPVLRLANYIEYPGHPLTQYNSLKEVAEKALAFRRELNSALTVRLTGWEQHGMWDNPFSMPPRDGLPEFSSMLTSLHDQGNRLELIRSVMRWSDLSPGFWDTGVTDAVRDEYGGLVESGSIALFSEVSERYVMCPATDAWRSTVEESARFAAALGVDWLALDEAPIGNYSHACYAADHGHVLGSGTWWTDATYSLLEIARAAAKQANPEMLLPTESPSEFYIPVSDSYVARRTFPDRSHYKSELSAFPGVQLPPIFQFVYHEYVVPYAEPFLDHEWAFSNSRYISVSQSLALISGEILGLRSQWFSALGATRTWLQSTRRHIEMWQSCGREFLMYGRMQRPPELDVPMVEVEPLAGESSDSPLLYPSVLASAWTSPFGAIGYFFSNIAEETIDVAPVLEGFGVFEGEEVQATIWRNGQPEKGLGILIPQTLALTLAPGDLVMIRLGSALSTDSPSPPETTFEFNDTARVVEFAIESGNSSDARTDESYFVIELTRTDLRSESVYRSMPGLAPGQSWKSTGQLTIPWDYSGALELDIHWYRRIRSERSVWEWEEVWSDHVVLQIPHTDTTYLGHECCCVNDDPLATVLRVDGITPGRTRIPAPSWSFWMQTSTSDSSHPLTPASSSGQQAIIAQNPTDATESTITMKFRSPFDASQYGGIELVLGSPESLPCSIAVAFMDCGMLSGSDCGWNTASTSCNLQTEEQPQRYRIPFASLTVPPWVTRKYPEASSVLDLTLIRALHFVIEEGEGTPGTIAIYEVSFYKDPE